MTTQNSMMKGQLMMTLNKSLLAAAVLLVGSTGCTAADQQSAELPSESPTVVVEESAGISPISAAPRWFDAAHGSSPYQAYIPDKFGDPASMAAAADLVAVVRVQDVIHEAEKRSLSPDEEGFASETALVFDGLSLLVTETLGKPTVDVRAGSEVVVLEPAALVRGDGSADLIPSENLEPLHDVLRVGESASGTYLAFIRFDDGVASLLPGGFVEVMPDGSLGAGGADGPFRNDEEIVRLPLTFDELKSWVNDGRTPAGWMPPVEAIPGSDDVSPPGILTNDAAENPRGD